MVVVYVDSSKKYICLKISGPKFEEIKNLIKMEYHFRFTQQDRLGIFNDCYWYGCLSDAEGLLEDLEQIDHLTITESAKNIIFKEPDTEFIRVKYNPEFLTAPPLGEYQERAIRQGITQSRCYLAHKQGLGKTYIAFGILNHLWHYGYVDRCLILCRPEGTFNLRRELLRFNTFGLREEDIYVVTTKDRAPFESEAKVVICNYRSFLMICDDAYKKAHKGKISKGYKKAAIDLSNWGTGRCLFLDEAHSCKNRQARQTKAIMLESDFFRFRYLMSGTPYPKGIEDLWSQFQIMDKELIGKPYYDWLGDVARLGTRFSEYEISSYKEDKIEKFLEKVKPWIIREFSTDNLNLPDQIEEKVYFQMTPAQRSIYEKFISYKLKEIMDGKEMKYVMKEVYSEFPRLMMSAIDPCMLKERVADSDDTALIKAVDKWKFEDNPRVSMCDSIVENHIELGDKIIIWSGHPSVIKRLGEHYAQYKPVLIHGEIEEERGIPRDRQIDNLVEDFKKDPEKKILIASYYMIATSKNIVEAPIMIYFDRPFDFVAVDQSKERNHRPTSIFDRVIVYNLIAEKSIEIKQDKVLERRQNLDKELLNYGSLSMQQWKELFNGEDDL